MAQHIDILIERNDFDSIIMEETTKFCKENPEQVEKAMWKDSFSKFAFRVLATRIRIRVIKECATRCSRCNEFSRVDVKHVCKNPGWKQIVANPKLDSTVI